ncbi:hypothetical protein NE237_024286 [Protea cynaroides]|uniref:ACB domain-containing protein n=1 Tax=Protea cynaroides TaxID=273540 RepID=A0A9Q0HHR6_9MAGN|nr:hypothetical protein NE237_024286 [Protea cynaroides]
MEFFLEICLTAFLSLIFAFLVAKLLSMVSDGDAVEQDFKSRPTEKFDGGVVEEERVLKEEIKNLRLEPEERVEFVGEAVKVDEFQADLAQESLERVHEGCESIEFLEGDQIAVTKEYLGEGVKTSGFLEDEVVEERPQEEERLLKEEMKSLRLEPEEKIKFFSEAVKFNEFQANLAQESWERVHEGDRMAVKEEDLEEGVKTSGFLEDELIEERPLEEEVKAGEADLGEVEKGFMSNKDDRMEDNLVEERPETGEVSEIKWELPEDELMPTKDEHVGDLGCESSQEKEIEGREKSEPNDEKGGMSGDEDEWEGIERSEVENLFANAAAFVGSLDNSDRMSKVGSDVQMQLYALHKVATEGPCHEPQPMALKVSARAKWNAWQGLGNMNPELAMEQYMSLLSDTVPGWMGENSGGDSKWDSVEAGISGEKAPDLRTSVHHHYSLETERKPEEHQSSVEGGDAKGDSVEAGISVAKASDLGTDVRHQHSLETERKLEEHQSSVEGGDAIGDPNSLNRDNL